MIGDDVEITVLAVMGDKVRIGIAGAARDPRLPQGGLDPDPRGGRGRPPAARVGLTAVRTLTGSARNAARGAVVVGASDLEQAASP